MSLSKPLPACCAGSRPGLTSPGSRARSCAGATFPASRDASRPCPPVSGTGRANLAGHSHLAAAWPRGGSGQRARRRSGRDADLGQVGGVPGRGATRASPPWDRALTERLSPSSPTMWGRRRRRLPSSPAPLCVPRHPRKAPAADVSRGVRNPRRPGAVRHPALTRVRRGATPSDALNPGASTVAESVTAGRSEVLSVVTGASNVVPSSPSQRRPHVAFTDDCDLYVAVSEVGANRIGQHIMEQRPSLFN